MSTTERRVFELRAPSCFPPVPPLRRSDDGYARSMTWNLRITTSLPRHLFRVSLTALHCAPSIPEDYVEELLVNLEYNVETNRVPRVADTGTAGTGQRHSSLDDETGDFLRDRDVHDEGMPVGELALPPFRGRRSRSGEPAPTAQSSLGIRQVHERRSKVGSTMETTATRASAGEVRDGRTRRCRSYRPSPRCPSGS